MENKNTGDRNIGDRNTGDCNVGDRNIGDCNTGYRNVGYRNAGDRNVGDCNVGDRNVGDCNTGGRNIGDRNVGDRNIGDRNIGGRNTGDCNVGYMNNTNSKVRIFWVQTDIDFWKIKFPDYFYFDFIPTYIERVNEWNMTYEEKENNQTYKTTWWFLRVTENEKDLKSQWKKARDKASHEDRMKTFDLPHFNADIFEDITWLHIHEYWKQIYKLKMNDWQELEFSSKEELLSFISNT